MLWACGILIDNENIVLNYGRIKKQFAFDYKSEGCETGRAY
jgi:hypothetical protein